jgi:hypothetical protein
MGDKEKSNIQKAVDLLEEAGYHVFKAEEEVYGEGICKGMLTGAVSLRIAPKAKEEE